MAGSKENENGNWNMLQELVEASFDLLMDY